MENVSFEAFCDLYATEADCISALFAAKWPDGFRCPRCGHSQAYLIHTRRLPLYECRACKAQPSLTSGTVMERTRTPLRLWFQAIYLHARPDGINALRLSQIISVTYKTAWLICHKLRYAMSQAEAEVLLSGLVKVTDAVLYPRIPLASGEWQKKEQALLAGVSEAEDGEKTHIKIKWFDKKTLPDRRTSPDVAPFIAQFVVPAAKTIIARRYDKKENRILGHPLRGVCGAAGWWLGWKFGGIGPKHLQVYLDHYCYMYNRKGEAICQILLQDCATRSTITYPELIATTNRRSYRLPRTAVQNHVIAS
ncbi:transposase [Cohnella silvisoli]|uniref:IS1595 family transposase n=1 Tax=Cohnella silvisoli TaxID=2873699 RepID=A0ABV1KQ95_9BACL|nr:transposase [Cohnella silvisoli]MCD9022105.1 transposase [Cohnella silvisoli]